MNVKFNYLYRDAANYKTYLAVVFANPDKEFIGMIRENVVKTLIDGEFFDPEKFHLKSARPNEFCYDQKIDHLWNEFISVDETTEFPTDKRTIKEFLEHIK